MEGRGTETLEAEMRHWTLTEAERGTEAWVGEDRGQQQSHPNHLGP